MEGWRWEGLEREGWRGWRRGLHFGCFRFDALLRGSVRCGNGSVRYCEIVLLKRPCSYVSIYIYVHIHIYIYFSIHTCINIYIYIYIYI